MFRHKADKQISVSDVVLVFQIHTETNPIQFPTQISPRPFVNILAVYKRKIVFFLLHDYVTRSNKLYGMLTNLMLNCSSASSSKSQAGAQTIFLFESFL